MTIRKPLWPSGECIDKARDSGLRLTTEIVVPFLTYLRSGMSQPLLGTIFCMTQQNVCRLIGQARSVLTESFVPLFLGNSRASGSRDMILANTSSYARTLYDVSVDTAIVICDGTYLYNQKSSYFPHQIATWCTQKNRNLTKPMLFVTTTGYIIDVFGLYEGKSSDADIMKQIMTDPKTQPWFQAAFKPGDIFVLDRGFKTCEETLKAAGFVVQMPRFLKGKQFTDEEANATRLCTMIRWVVEARNHSLKSNKYLSNVVDNKNLPHLLDDVRIAAALINAFDKPLVVSNDDEEACERAVRANERADDYNHLQLIIESHNLTRKPSAAEAFDFNVIPQLDAYDMRQLSGSYQMRLAMSYLDMQGWDSDDPPISRIKSTIVKDSDFSAVNLAVGQPLLVKARVKSRHTKTTVYQVFILYDLNKEDDDVVVQTYCQCKAGARTTDCCAHALMVIWYLSMGRFFEDVQTPGAFLKAHMPVNPRQQNPV